MSKQNFIQSCLGGYTLPEEIDDFIDTWHEGDGEGLELWEYLGMTRSEYNLWLVNENSLAFIIQQQIDKEKRAK